MNCRPKDLAIVVRNLPYFAPIVGRVVRVEMLIESEWPKPITGPTWAIEKPLQVAALVRMTGQRGVVVSPGEQGFMLGLPDSILRPIRDQPGEDEMLRVAGRPFPVLV